jgi:hypothetical protein
MAALHQILARWQRLGHADNRFADERQAACARLADLLDRAWATLPSQCENRKHRTAPGDTITLLDQYARDMTAWHATNGWLFQHQAPAMLEHVRHVGALSHAIATLLRDLADAEHILSLISRLNVCVMKLELEVRAVKRHIQYFVS